MNLKTGSKQLESLQELLLLGVWAGRMVQRMSEDSKGLSRKEELELLLALERVRHSVERSLSRTQPATSNLPKSQKDTGAKDTKTT